MKIWQILARTLKKYENLVKFGILELAPPLKMLEFWKGEGGRNFGISPTFIVAGILELMGCSGRVMAGAWEWQIKEGQTKKERSYLFPVCPN